MESQAEMEPEEPHCACEDRRAHSGEPRVSVCLAAFPGGS